MKNRPDVLGSVTGGIDAYLIAKLRSWHRVYHLPPALDRQSMPESDRRDREIAIARGVVEAAGLSH
jgi:hypothetical protein